MFGGQMVILVDYWERYIIVQVLYHKNVWKLEEINKELEDGISVVNIV